MKNEPACMSFSWNLMNSFAASFYKVATTNCYDSTLMVVHAAHLKQYKQNIQYTIHDDD